MSDLASIENLLHDDKPEEGSVLDKFSKKQAEIKAKEIEQITEYNAGRQNLPYINLINFPISPESLALIDEENARSLQLVCFYYDGKSIKLATTSNNQTIIDLAKDLADRYFATSTIFLVSDGSLNYALDLYKILPKVKKYEGMVEISEEKLNQFKEELTDYHLLNEKINEVITILNKLMK
jgi:hypothetical protein